ncbi:MAG: AMP-binding protein [Crocosphaera sp.]
MLNQTNLIDLLQETAIKQPDKIAYTFLEDGKTEAQQLTYKKLEQRAKAIAAHLQSLDSYGERALLLYPAGLEFLCAFFGCLYAGVIGIPAPPPEASRLKRTLPRLQAIAKDSQTSLVLCNSKITSIVDQAREQVPELQPIKWLDTEVINNKLSQKWQKPNINGDTLAYLQYTSGSTATPKGVMISHYNVIYHCHNLQRSCNYNADSVTVTWMPYFHDYGLVEGLLTPLYNGTPCYVMSPVAFIKRPLRWLEAISRYKATHSQAPNFAYDQCVRRIREKQRENLDLSHWKAAGNAAEPINPEVLERFAQYFAPVGFSAQAFCPAYGLAEATLLVSFSPQEESFITTSFIASELEKRRIVEADNNSSGLIRTVASCGRLMQDISVKIINPDTLTLCSPDEVGEVWVKDPSVAQGYWQRKKDTEETFQAYIKDTGEGPFLRTGDFGFIYQDQLYISGRIKDVIIIRGTNHYPQDIEWTVQGCDPALRPENGAAFSVEIEGEEKLVIAQEIERGYKDTLTTEEIAAKIRRAMVEEHELDTHAILFLKRGSLPKTASGKIQRRACQAQFLKGTLDILGSWNVNSQKKEKMSKNTITNHKHTPAHKVALNQAKSAKNSQQRADKIINWLRDYGDKRINSRLMDERRSVPPYILLDFGNQGILGMQISEKYGGLGLTYRDFLRVLEQVAAIDTNLAFMVFLNNTNGIRPIQHYGTPALQEELLPLLATGRILGSYGLSEPGAGSNLGGISTVATPNGPDSWTLKGVKRWNSSSGAGVISAFVRLVDENNKLRGMTGFAVRTDSPGVRIGPEALTMGVRGSVQNSIYFDDVSVNKKHLLGEIGKGMEVADDALLMGRIGTATLCLGAMKRCAQLMLRYASRRPVATGLLLDNPITLARFSQLTQVITVVDTMLSHLAQELDQGKTLPLEVAMVVKIIASEGACRGSDDCIQLLGGRGYMENNFASQIYRDVRLLTIGEGPNENLRAYLGKSVMQSDNLHDYLTNTLNAGDISQKLRDTAQEVSDRCLANLDTFGDRSAALSWTHYLIGEAVIYGVLLATVQQSQDAALYSTIEWTKQQFEASITQALGGTTIESVMLTSQATKDKVASYFSSIGDIEQGASGEEIELEPLLKRESQPKPKPAPKSPDMSNLSPEEKKELLTKLLQKKANSSNIS